VVFEGERLTIGRSNGNDIVLDDPNVSRFHAEVLPSGGLLELRDLDSRCGTRLDGRPVKRAVIKTGSEIGVGSHRLRFDGSRFVGHDERGALRLDARSVSVRTDGKTILDGVSLAAEPGELVAIIGQSGAGKSTLIKALAGVLAPGEGSVTLNGEPVTARLTDVGYVPQEEIVHRLLTVDEALGYAARLRLPDDTEARDRASTIRRVLTELSLEEQASTRIDSLSGGERKRASVASELLGRPSMLFLDEPTTGLDPGLESEMMALFRTLAEPGIRAVLMVTHATKNLSLCDRLAVIGRGGVLTFFGTPADALRFFAVESYDDIYVALEHQGSAEWRARFERERGASAAASPAVAPTPGPTGSARAKQRSGVQLAVLVGRYVRLLSRDGRNLLILLGQVPVIALAIAFLFQPDLFSQGGFREVAGRPDQAVQLLFLLVTTVIWLGSIDGSREIVKERAIAAREATVGVRLGPYLISKAVVLFGLSSLQTLALTYLVLAVHPLGEAPATYATVTGLLLLTSFAAVGVGLLVSAAASSEDQATSFIPLTLIPQLLFAGAIVPLAQTIAPIAFLSHGLVSRWSLAGVGGAVDMTERLSADPRVAELAGYGPTFFEITGLQAAFVLAVLAGVAFAITALLASRRRRAALR
jgi:ABC-type multidrug transport system ATPase subunit